MTKTAKVYQKKTSGTYHIPDHEIDYFEVKQALCGGHALWAIFINRLGMYEDIFGDRQIEDLNREQRDKIAAVIRTV